MLNSTIRLYCPSIVKQERPNASLGEATSKEIDVHLLNCTNTVSHGNRRHRFIGVRSLRQKEPASAQVVGALECHVAFFNRHRSPTSKLPDRFDQSVVSKRVLFSAAIANVPLPSTATFPRHVISQ